jgi:hypothetical protein
MPRRHWDELPPAVRHAIEDHTGPVTRADSVATGSVAELATTLRTATGTVFCKGITTDNPNAWLHRNEARLNPVLPDAAPRLRWIVDTANWLILGFDHIIGHHPDLSAASADLPTVFQALASMSAALTPCPAIPVQPATARWDNWIAPEWVDGDTLLHTDVTPRNFLIGDRTWIVDWSTPCRGAAWIDTAFMVIRCIRAGHTPKSAESWASTNPVWITASRLAVDAFSTGVADLYRERERQSPAPHRIELAEAAQLWAAYRTRSRNHRSMRPHVVSGRGSD